MFQTTTRNASLSDLFDLLQTQQAHKHDIVVPAGQIHSRDGLIVVRGSQPVLTSEGVSMVDGTYRPTAVFDEGVAARLGIQLSYLRRLRTQRPDIYDANVNGWLHGSTVPIEAAGPASTPVTRTTSGTTTEPVTGPARGLMAGTVAGTATGPGTDRPYPADQRQFLLRLFTDEGGSIGVGRAFLSDKYARIENLDILISILEALHASGVEVEIAGGDLSERRMYLRVSAPSVAAFAPELMRDYRSPFTGARGLDNPLVFAGFEISNSEVGNGAFSITPRLTFQVCNNGATIVKDAVRSVHLGGRLDEGVITWTEDTQRKQLELIKARTRDCVSTFLDLAYVNRVLGGLSERAAVKLPDPQASIRTLAKKLAFDEQTTAGILTHFIQGGDISAGGVMQAVTAFAQTVPDADLAADLEGSAIPAMELAAASA